MPAASSYDQEQEALRQQTDGEIRITPPKEPEVNPEVYRDVEPLLFRGFLTLPADINGAIFVFKSLNHHEFEMLRLTGLVRESGSVSTKFWDLFLSYGIFMIDGQNVLLDRDRWLPQIAETFAAMPERAKQRVIRHMSEINRRAASAVTLTEAYFTEGYSRFRWAQYKGIDLSSTSVTGVPGTERLGLNWAQLTWRALNYFEDRNEEIERVWDNAKFVGSCFAGKGVQKIYTQDTQRRQKDREERLSRKDRILREILLGEKIGEKVKQLQGARLIAAHTVEELSDQLEKDLRGEKDWHDQVIAEHQERIAHNLNMRKQQIRQFSDAHEVEFGRKMIVGGTDASQPLTAAEVQQRIVQNRRLEAHQAAQQMLQQDIADPTTVEKLDKWGISGSEVGVTLTETDRDPAGALPIPLPRQGATPFGRK